MELMDVFINGVYPENWCFLYKRVIIYRTAGFVGANATKLSSVASGNTALPARANPAFVLQDEQCLMMLHNVWTAGCQ